MMRGSRLIASAVSFSLIGAAMVLYVHRNGDVRLPYTDTFRSHDVSKWQPFGGSWKWDTEGIAVAASETGAKLVLDPLSKTDYQAWSDVKLLGHDGNVGVVVRSGEMGVGAESIRGYVVVLRSSDAGLEITRADGSFLSLEPAHLPGGVHQQVWYRLHIVVVGCSIAVEVRDLRTGQAAYSGFHDRPQSCIPAGSVALRTTATGASWRNVRIQPATAADLTSVAEHTRMNREASFPIRERDFTAMRESYLAHVPADEISRPANLGTFGPLDDLETSKLANISDLRGQLWSKSLIRIVGIVTSVSPLYLQDHTGGVALVDSSNTVFRLGDEVEVIGHANVAQASLRFTPVAGRFLSDRVPVAPLSLNATQAASGMYEGSLVEVSGEVQSVQTEQDGSQDVGLTDEAQRFAVHVPYDIFNARRPHLQKYSRIRVRGVCATSKVGAEIPGAFVLYPASASDVVELQGPPWWRGEHLAWIIIGGFGLAVCGVLLYGAEQRARLRMVQGERERLAHDMHDTLAQSIAGVGFRLQGIHRSLLESGVVPKVFTDELNATWELVVTTHREASSSIAMFHPESGKERDVLRRLEEAVYAMLDDDEFPVIVTSQGTPKPLSPVVSDTLFRVGREAIANALRHAQARSIRVQLAYRVRDVLLTISDDGKGFDLTAQNAGFGIRSMMQRCASIKATLSITSIAEGGCKVQVSSPYRVHRGLVSWVG